MLRHALRALRRSPLYAATAILTLALGIGATALIFSVVSALVLRPPPYAQPDRLVHITVLKGTSGVTPDSFVASAPELVRWRRNRQLADVGALRPMTFALSGDAEPRTLTGALVSAGLFTTLGVAPERGRVFTEAEDIPNPTVVVISHALWMSAFAGSPAAIGRTLTIDGEAREVIGVMPRNFRPLVRLMLAENLLLSAGGVTLGVLIARVTLRPLLSLEPSATALLVDARVDAGVLAFAIALSVATAVLCAVLPAIRATRTDPAEVLKESSTRAGGSTADRRARLALMTAQVALTLVLLTGAIAMLDTVRTLERTDVGFDGSSILVLNLRLPATRYADIDRRNLFVTQALDAMRATPGVEAASATSHLFSTDINMQTMVEYEGKPAEDESGEGVYFRGLGSSRRLEGVP